MKNTDKVRQSLSRLHLFEFPYREEIAKRMNDLLDYIDEDEGDDINVSSFDHFIFLMSHLKECKYPTITICPGGNIILGWKLEDYKFSILLKEKGAPIPYSLVGPNNFNSHGVYSSIQQLIRKLKSLHIEGPSQEGVNGES